MKHLLPSIAWLSAALTIGCGELQTQYESSMGRTADQSVNGLGAFRRSLTRHGYRTSDVRRLSSRLDQTDLIIWSPRDLEPPNAEVIQWFESWLADRQRRLLIIIPDSGNELEYWKLARNLAPPPQQLEYRRRIARRTGGVIAERASYPDSIDYAWFTVDPLLSTVPVAGLNPIHLRAADAVVDLAASPQREAEMVIRQTPAVSVTPSSTPWADWIPLLETSDGRAVVADLIRDGDAKPRVTVVGGSSWLTNFSLTTPSGRALATHLLGNPPAGAKAVFVSSVMGMIPVSESATEDTSMATGFELLTVWPLSLITLHLCWMGIVACLILLPIFGRPRPTEDAGTNDFSDHLDAVAALMVRSDNEAGRREARQKTSEYLRRVAGDVTRTDSKPPPRKTSIG